MTQALAIKQHHNTIQKGVKEAKNPPTEQSIKVGITAEKTVLLVQAKTVVNSVNLEVGATYYAEVCGNAHYYISRFPSGKLSHMGVYQKVYFKVVGEEIVSYEPRLHELKQLRREGKLNELQLQQLADFENGAVIASVPIVVDPESSVTVIPNDSTVTEPVMVEEPQEPVADMVEEEQKKELVEIEKAFLDSALLSEEEREARLRQQAHEESRPDDNAYPQDLLHDRIYSAELVWCKYSYRAETFVGKRLFIQRISKDNPYYKASDCSVFTDQECKEPLAGRLKLAWFADFKLVVNEEDNVIILDENSEVSPAGTETTTIPLKDLVEKEKSSINIREDIEKVENTVKGNSLTSMDSEEETLELEQLSLFF